ncbi:hypothetical protein [Nocardioides marinquilinus]
MARTLPPAAPPPAPLLDAVRLRPGVHVVRRDAEHLQVGLDAPGRVIVRGDGPVAALLDDLTQGRAPHRPDERGRRLLSRLADAGLLVGPDDDDPAPRGTVELVDRGLDLGPLRPLLAASGIACAVDGTPPALRVVASSAPLPRAVVDPWMRDGVPHLVLAGTGGPGSLRLGPLVAPGRSACLRCVDAHEAVLDPRRPLIVEQLADRPAVPPSPALLALALAWTAREVHAHLTGERATTWSATLDLHDGVPELRRWERHPHCGCAWHELGYR